MINLMDEQFIVSTRIIDGPDRAVGRNATFKLNRGFYSSFPDYTHDIEEMIAEGDRVAVKVVLRGTQLEASPETGRVDSNESTASMYVASYTCPGSCCARCLLINMNITLWEWNGNTFGIKSAFDFPCDVPVNIPVIVGLNPGATYEVHG